MLSSPLLLTNNQLAHGPLRNRVLQFLARQSVCHYTQHPDWACAHDVKNFIGVGTLANDALVAWTLVRRRRIPVIRLSKYFGERGPVVENPEFLPQHIADLIRVLAPDGLYLALHPFVFAEPGKRLANQLFELGFVRAHNNDKHYGNTLTIDLTVPLETIRAGFRRSLKTQINKAERLGITVTQLSGSADYRDFTQRYVYAMNEKTIRTPSNISSLLNTFAARPHGYALQAHWHGELVAGIGLVSGGRNLVYEWGYTSGHPDHRSLPLQHALHWQAIQLAKKAGFHGYDLGGFWIESGNKNPINLFKLGFGGVPMSSGGALQLYWRQRLSRLLTIRPSHLTFRTGV